MNNVCWLWACTSSSRNVREGNTALAAIPNEHEEGAKNLEKNMDEKELNVNLIVLLWKLKPEKKEVEWLECENNLLRLTTEGMLHSAIQEAGTSLMHA